MPAGQEHVFRLEVAVDNAVGVRVSERRGDIVKQVDRLGDTELRLAFEPASQRLAGDERHTVVRTSARIARSQHRYDERMLEAGGDEDFSSKAFDGDATCELGRQ